MYDSSPQITLRACTVWLAVTGAVGALSAVAVPSLATWRGREFADLLVGGCAVAAVVAAGWLWLVTTDVVLGVLTTGAPRPRPGAVRALVLAACGVAALAGPAAAVERDPAHGPDHPRALAPERLAGLPLPDRPTGPAGPRRADEERLQVRPGDTLWTIAATRLGAGATPAEITSYWQRVHALNAELIGPDPHLIHPGQLLRLPPTTRSTR